MNVLFVHAIGKRKFWGGEKWLIMAACGLRDKGHRVIVGGRPGSRLLDCASRNGLETASMNIISDISLYHSVQMARYMRANAIDVVITRERDLAVTGVAARLGGNPLVLVRHGLPLMCSIKKHLFLIRRFADGIIANTASIKDLYESKGWLEPEVTRVIYNGTPVVDGTMTYDFGAEFPGKRVILTAGRLASQKGYSFLLEAAASLRDSHQDLVFVFLGEGKLRKRLESQACRLGVEDMVHFAGYVENVSPYLMGCEMFVLPSLYEGMPNAAMEAMAHGKSVIISNVNGAGELVDHGISGLLIPPRDAGALAASISRLLADKALCDKMGANARTRVSEHFRVSSMVEQLEAYIAEKREECRGVAADTKQGHRC